MKPPWPSMSSPCWSVSATRSRITRIVLDIGARGASMKTRRTVLLTAAWHPGRRRGHRDAHHARPGRCLQCATVYELPDRIEPCPHCGSARKQWLSGQLFTRCAAWKARRADARRKTPGRQVSSFEDACHLLMGLNDDLRATQDCSCAVHHRVDWWHGVCALLPAAKAVAQLEASGATCG